METQNITLALSKEVLRKAKLLATKRRTSMSGLMRQALEDLVSREEDYELARQRQLVLLNQGFDLNTKGYIAWKREDLYER
jgi:predicted transcriptional regulator